MQKAIHNEMVGASHASIHMGYPHPVKLQLAVHMTCAHAAQLEHAIGPASTST